MEKLKVLRIEKGLSQKDLSERLNVSQGALSSWESGRYEPDIATVIKIADIFNISIDELVGRVEGINFASKAIPIEKAPALPEEEQELVEIFEQLDAEGKAMVKAAAYGELRRMRALPDAGASVG